MDEEKITALYERLSHDDEMVGDSNSIRYQEKYLMEYANSNGFPHPTHFTEIIVPYMIRLRFRDFVIVM